MSKTLRRMNRERNESFNNNQEQFYSSNDRFVVILCVTLPILLCWIARDEKQCFADYHRRKG